ncbi:MAG: GNAT family N-acetyltransferase [Gammaproteobacteria bacterium]
MGPLMIDDRGSAPRARKRLDDLLASLPGFAWQIGLTRQDPLYSRFLGSAHQPRIEKINDWVTTHIDVDGSFEPFWQTRAKKVRQDVRRIFRRLETSSINWRLEVLRDHEAMPAGVRQYGELESVGWKGREGTAIHSDNVQGEFYTRVLQGFARAGDARIYQLYLDDRLAASLLTISRNRMLVVLKTTYDESVASLSPGRLIDYLMLEWAFADKDIGRIENYTNASAEDARWCSGSRNLYHVNYYRYDAMRRLTQVRRRLQTKWRERKLAALEVQTRRTEGCF